MLYKVVLFCSRHFSYICLRSEAISVVHLLALKAHWPSVKLFSVMDRTSLLRSNSFAITFPAMESRVITWYFEQSYFSLSFLYNAKLRRSCDCLPCSQHAVRNSWSLAYMTGSHAFVRLFHLCHPLMLAFCSSSKLWQLCSLPGLEAHLIPQWRVAAGCGELRFPGQLGLDWRVLKIFGLHWRGPENIKTSSWV